MVQRRLDEAAKAMSGDLVGARPDRLFDGASLDSRTVQGGELFFALPGEVTDGHNFVPQAFERGAAAAVVSAPVSAATGHGLIRVEDTYAALHALTRHVRQEVPRSLVALTGSVGKTTTKNLLAAMLARRYRVAATPGNLNNLYGFPIALLGIPDDTEWMVAEMGMSTPGELAQVSLLGLPDVAILLNVRAAHLEAFDDASRGAPLRRIAEAKAEILEGLSARGQIVANAGDEEVRGIVEHHLNRTSDVRVSWYAALPETTSGLDLWLRDVRLLDGGARGSRFTLEGPGGGVEVELPLYGTVNAENFLAAAACAAALGVALEEIAASASSAIAAPGRGVVYDLGEGIVLIDDSYNSNPDALERALEAARQIPGRRHWAVVGAMLELGSASKRFHQQAGKRAAGLGFSPILGVGDETRALVAAATSEGAHGEWFADGQGAAARVQEGLQAGDVVLVKGSRGVALERVVEAVRRGQREETS